MAEGTFSNKAIVEGTYKFSNGHIFLGKRNSQGNRYNGVFTSPSVVTVVLQNAKAIAPERTTVIGTNSQAALTCANQLALSALPWQGHKKQTYYANA